MSNTTEGNNMSEVATHWSESLSNMGACGEAVRYAKTHESFAAAWSACDRGDWMLWLLGKLSGSPDSDARRKLVLVSAEHAELALPIFEKYRPGDTRVRECIEACKRYAAGEIDMAKLRKYRAAAANAAADAYAAAAAAARADANAVADAYAAAASAACASANAAADAYARAANAAADAYARAAYARAKIKRQCVDIVRKHYPNPPEIAP